MHFVRLFELELVCTTPIGFQLISCIISCLYFTNHRLTVLLSATNREAPTENVMCYDIYWYDYTINNGRSNENKMMQH